MLYATLVGQTPTETSTTAIAAGAVTSPVWLMSLNDASGYAAMWAPILGVIWLIVQIVSKLLEIRKKITDEE